MLFSPALVVVGGACTLSRENPFPTRPVRVVVGFTPGGQPDISARVIGARLSELLGQQVIVDNRPGAGGVIGTKIVADATPDGHTLLSVSASHVIAPAVYAKLPYNTLRDFAGVTQTVSASYLLVVSPSLGVKNVQELVALAQSKPGQINFGSAGTGSGTHFAGEILKSAAGIDAAHVAAPNARFSRAIIPRGSCLQSSASAESRRLDRVRCTK